MEVITAGKVVSVFFDVVCGELLSVIKKVWTRSKQFKPLLEQLKSTVERITPIFEDIESLNEDVLWPATQTAALGKQLDEAKDLVGKCDRARWWNKSSYAKKLIDYDKSFTRFFQIDVPAQILHGVRRVEKNQAREWARVALVVPRPELDAPAPYSGEPEDPIALLRNSPQFQALRPLLKKNPRLLELTLQGLEKKYPDIFGRNKEHEAAFRKLIDEPVDGSDGDLSDQPEQEMPPAINVSHAEQEMPHTISVILAEQEAIERLEEMGFDSDLVIEAFLACDGNEELAVNYLLENAGYFED